MKPKIEILKFGSIEKLQNPQLPGANGLHVTTGMIIYEQEGLKKGMVIDPGMAVDFSEHVKKIQQIGLMLSDISHLLITHLHQDHIQALGKYPDGVHIFHYGSSSILGSSEYGAKVYVNGMVEISEVRFELFPNTHSQKDTIYIVDSANEGVVAFIGDLAFSLFDAMPKENQKSLDVGASIDPTKRWQVLFDFYNQHQEVQGYYLGHYHRKVSREELGKYLEEWKN